MENKKIKEINDTNDIDETGAIEAMYRLMLEADGKVKKAALAKGMLVYDDSTLVSGGLKDYASVMEQFCMDFVQFWADTDSILRQALRQGEGVSKLTYDHQLGEFYYGDTLVGKTEVKLEEALVRKYLITPGGYWREDVNENGVFYYDLRKRMLERLSNMK